MIATFEKESAGKGGVENQSLRRPPLYRRKIGAEIRNVQIIIPVHGRKIYLKVIALVHGDRIGSKACFRRFHIEELDLGFKTPGRLFSGL